MIDTSAEALLKLADKLWVDEEGTDPGILFSDIDKTLRALAAERNAAAPDVVERVARAIVKALREGLSPEGVPLDEYIEILRDKAEVERWGIIWPCIHDRGSAIRDDQLEIIGKVIAPFALAALRPGDEVPAGVVVPREMTEEMLEAASHAGLMARDLIRDKHPHRRGFADAEWLPASWRAALSAIKGGEDE